MASRPIGSKPSPSNLTGLTAGVGKARSQKTRDAERNGPTSSQARGGDSVKVNLSDRSKRLQEDKATAFAIAKGTSPVREDRIAELKQRIQNGQYEINAGNIADGMLTEAIKERLAEHS